MADDAEGTEESMRVEADAAVVEQSVVEDEKGLSGIEQGNTVVTQHGENQDGGERVKESQEAVARDAASNVELRASDVEEKHGGTDTCSTKDPEHEKSSSMTKDSGEPLETHEGRKTGSENGSKDNAGSSEHVLLEKDAEDQEGSGGDRDAKDDPTDGQPTEETLQVQTEEDGKESIGANKSAHGEQGNVVESVGGTKTNSKVGEEPVKEGDSLQVGQEAGESNIKAGTDIEGGHEVKMSSTDQVSADNPQADRVKAQGAPVSEKQIEVVDAEAEANADDEKEDQQKIDAEVPQKAASLPQSPPTEVPAKQREGKSPGAVTPKAEKAKKSGSASASKSPAGRGRGGGARRQWEPMEGELVWAKVRSHPWWPARVLSPKEATGPARKSQRPGHLLIGFYGDQTFNWLRPDEVLPFVPHFPEKLQGSALKLFGVALAEALSEMDDQLAATGTLVGAAGEEVAQRLAEMTPEALLSVIRASATDTFPRPHDALLAALLRQRFLRHRAKAAALRLDREAQEGGEEEGKGEEVGAAGEGGKSRQLLTLEELMPVEGSQAGQEKGRMGGEKEGKAAEDKDEEEEGGKGDEEEEEEVEEQTPGKKKGQLGKRREAGKDAKKRKRREQAGRQRKEKGPPAPKRAKKERKKKDKADVEEGKEREGEEDKEASDEEVVEQVEPQEEETPAKEGAVESKEEESGAEEEEKRGGGEAGEGDKKEEAEQREPEDEKEGEEEGEEEDDEAQEIEDEDGDVPAAVLEEEEEEEQQEEQEEEQEEEGVQPACGRGVRRASRGSDEKKRRGRRSQAELLYDVLRELACEPREGVVTADQHKTLLAWRAQAFAVIKRHQLSGSVAASKADGGAGGEEGGQPRRSRKAPPKKGAVVGEEGEEVEEEEGDAAEAMEGEESVRVGLKKRRKRGDRDDAEGGDEERRRKRAKGKARRSEGWEGEAGDGGSRRRRRKSTGSMGGEEEEDEEEGEGGEGRRGGSRRSSESKARRRRSLELLAERKARKGQQEGGAGGDLEDDEEDNDAGSRGPLQAAVAPDAAKQEGKAGEGAAAAPASGAAQKKPLQVLKMEFHPSMPVPTVGEVRATFRRFGSIVKDSVIVNRTLKMALLTFERTEDAQQAYLAASKSVTLFGGRQVRYRLTYVRDPPPPRQPSAPQHPSQQMDASLHHAHAPGTVGLQEAGQLPATSAVPQVKMDPALVPQPPSSAAWNGTPTTLGPATRSLPHGTPASTRVVLRRAPSVQSPRQPSMGGPTDPRQRPGGPGTVAPGRPVSAGHLVQQGHNLPMGMGPSGAAAETYGMGLSGPSTPAPAPVAQAIVDGSYAGRDVTTVGATVDNSNPRAQQVTASTIPSALNLGGLGGGGGGPDIANNMLSLLQQVKGIMTSGASEAKQ